ncbi:hypothetical protein D3C87_999120 [compost metagenome]
MAQITVTGCVVPSTQVVYTFKDNGSGIYNVVPSTDLSAECYSSSTSGSPCVICMNGLNGGGHCPPGNGNPTNGTIVSFTIEDCPIDDYLLPLILTLAGLGGFFVRKRTLLPV